MYAFIQTQSYIQSYKPKYVYPPSLLCTHACDSMEEKQGKGQKLGNATLRNCLFYFSFAPS